MPEDLPKAVLILLWLLIGVIVIGYLVMKQSLVITALFAFFYYGAVSLWYIKRNKQIKD